jgi:5-formyltetrahydrofolate cyclo-ligase
VHKIVEFKNSNKPDLRKKFKNKFLDWAGDQANPSSLFLQEQELINKHLTRFLKYTKICYFKSIWGEPNLDQTVKAHPSTQWILPKVCGDELELRIVKENSILVEGAFGILEPDAVSSPIVDINEIKLFLVPGLAFDSLGARLGRGKAYYDKTLKNFKGTKVGVAFSCQISPTLLPREPHDVMMDFLVTHEGVRKVQ